MSLFKNLATDGLEETVDTVGGFTPVASGIYPATIKLAFLDQWASRANLVDLTFTINGKDYNEKVTITNKKGENFYVKGDKRFPLPGFTTVDDICLITVGKGLADMESDTETKTVKVYDKDTKTEVPKAKQVLVSLLGKTLTVAIQQSIETVMDKDGKGEYTVPTEKTRNTNSLEKVFDTASMMTVVEARAGNTVGEFHKLWAEKNTGVVRDKLHKGTATVKTVGGAPVAGAPAGGARKPLFGNK